jgi:hypothetical protein
MLDCRPGRVKRDIFQPNGSRKNRPILLKAPLRQFGLTKRSTIPVALLQNLRFCVAQASGAPGAEKA